MAKFNVYFTKRGCETVEAETYQEATEIAEARVEDCGEPDAVWDEWEWDETYEQTVKVGE